MFQLSNYSFVCAVELFSMSNDHLGTEHLFQFSRPACAILPYFRLARSVMAIHNTCAIRNYESPSSYYLSILKIVKSASSPFDNRPNSPSREIALAGAYVTALMIYIV